MRSVFRMSNRSKSLLSYPAPTIPSAGARRPSAAEAAADKLDQVELKRRLRVESPTASTQRLYSQLDVFGVQSALCSVD